MDEWKSARLRDVGVVLIDCAHKTPEARASGYPYVGIPQMKNGRIDFSTARLISHDDYLEWTKKAKPQKHDVVLSRRTNPGVTAIDDTGTEFALGQNLVLLRADGTKMYPPFLRWLTQSPQWWDQIAKFNNVGAIFDSLKCADVPNFELPVPPRDIQKPISNILGALDDKIDLNRRMNETLERTARAIFKDWFVDFGPTRAKMEGRAAYLAPEIWEEFPESFEGDELPLGWKRSRIDDLIEFNPSERLPAGINAPYLDMAALPTVGPNADAHSSRPFKSGSKFRNGDTLFARITPCLENGKTAFVHGLPENAVASGSTEFIVLRSRSPVPPAVSYLIARDPAFRAHAIQSMTGTSGRQRAEVAAVSRFEVAVSPSARLWTLLGRMIDPIFDKIAAADLESRALAATRDLLLPKLMSGEIRVREAEKIVGEVA